MPDHTLIDTYQLDQNNIPEHVAIVMDGNGRWAQSKHLPRVAGHKAGSEALRRVLTHSVQFGIKYLSMYTFSTENWSRPKTEVSFLMNLLKHNISRELPEMIKQGVRLRFMGDIKGLSNDLQDVIEKAEKETSLGGTIQLNLLFNYGSRDEIIHACQNIIQDGVSSQDITEDLFSSYLYTAGIPDPDVFIRTSRELRISNYMLWQLSYAELFFLDVLWPDFDHVHLGQVLKEYQERHRRYGGL